MKNAKLNILLFALVSFVSLFSSDAPESKKPAGMSRTERAKMNRGVGLIEEGGHTMDAREAMPFSSIWRDEEFLRKERECSLRIINETQKLLREEREREERERGLKAINANNKRDAELKNPALAPDGSKNIEPITTLSQADTQAASSSTASSAVTTSVVGKKLSEEAAAELLLQMVAGTLVQIAAHDRDLLDAYLEAIKSATTQEEKNELALKLIAQYEARGKQREAARKTRYGAL